MKKLALFFILVLCFGLVGCNNGSQPVPNSKSEQLEGQETVELSEPESTAVPFHPLISLGEKTIQLETFESLVFEPAEQTILLERTKEIGERLEQKMDDFIPNHPDNLSYIFMGVKQGADEKQYYTVKVVQKTETAMDPLYYFFTVNLEDYDEWYITEPVTAQDVPFQHALDFLEPEEIRILIHQAYLPDLDLDEIPLLEDDYADEFTIDYQSKTLNFYLVPALNFISIWDSETEETHLFYYYALAQ